MTPNDHTKPQAVEAAINSATGRRLAGRVLADGVLSRVLADDPAGFIEAINAPSAATIKAALAEMEGLPQAEQADLHNRAQIITSEAVTVAVDQLWRVVDRLALDNPQALPADAVALVAATMLMGELSGLVDGHGHEA